MTTFQHYRFWVRAKLREYENRRKRFTPQQAINLTHGDGNHCIHEAAGLFTHHYSAGYCFSMFLEARANRYVYQRALRKGHGIPTPDAIQQFMDERGYQRRVGIK